MPDSIVDLPGEIWKPIPNWAGFYSASNKGRVKSLDRHVLQRTRYGGSFVRFCRGQIIKPRTDKDGYLRVNLSGNGIAAHFVPVHRLVLEAFAGPCPDGMVCCHGDGNRVNNCLENLRWDTDTANKADMIAHGTNTRRGRKRLTASEVRSIKTRLAAGDPQHVIAKDFNKSHATINCIARGTTWKSI